MIRPAVHSNRIDTLLAEYKEQNKKALVLFITAGFPKLESTVPLVIRLAESGADIIELGMPFSDPLADGPMIQASSQLAIRNGITLQGILKDVKEIRKHTDIPIALMGYLNPLLQYGEERFFFDAEKAGVDGVILPEISFEESGRFSLLCDRHHLANILFVSPTTPEKRIKKIDKSSTGFLYCVSTTGVTGRSDIGNIESYLRRVTRAAKNNSVLVGFGIKTPEDARSVSQCADGIIIGSALVQKMMQEEPLEDICRWVKTLKDALK